MPDCFDEQLNTLLCSLPPKPCTVVVVSHDKPSVLWVQIILAGLAASYQSPHHAYLTSCSPASATPDTGVAGATPPPATPVEEALALPSRGGRPLVHLTSHISVKQYGPGLKL